MISPPGRLQGAAVTRHPIRGARERESPPHAVADQPFIAASVSASRSWSFQPEPHASGLAFGYTTFRGWAANTKVGDGLWKRFRRYGWLLAIGYAMAMPALSLTRLLAIDDPNTLQNWMRVDVLQHTGLSLAILQLIAVVVRTEIDYRKPATLGDHLIISGRLERLERARFWVAFEIRRMGEETLLITCRQSLALVQMPQGRPLRLPEDWAEKIGRAHV